MELCGGGKDTKGRDGQHKLFSLFRPQQKKGRISKKIKNLSLWKLHRDVELGARPNRYTVAHNRDVERSLASLQAHSGWGLRVNK